MSIYASIGSPPRVWGKELQVIYSFPSQRITPTCEGKRLNAVGSGLTLRDHPHVCGEKKPTKNKSTVLPGSPPRVWGKASVPDFSIFALRITPTCVGKSHPCGVCQNRKWDHPHVCGEKRVFATSLYALSGSPPRVWGKAGSGGTDDATARITPTCVGKRKAEAN